METVELTPNLNLTSIMENNVQDDRLITVCCYFTFYGQQGEAYIVIDSLDDEWPNYAMVNSGSDLHDSFNDQLEENWDAIANRVKLYHEEFKKEMAEY